MTVRARTSGAIATLLGAAAIAAPAIAFAEAPADSAATTKSFASAPSLGLQVGCAGSVQESQIAVPAGSVGAYLNDIDVTTSIDHTHAGDLKIELVAPNGKTIQMVGANQADHAQNVFSGTVWDDSSTVPAATYRYGTNDPRPQASLAPHGRFGSLVGINPAGTWKLRVTDTADDCTTVPGTPPADSGTLNNWSISLSTRAAAPTIAARKSFEPAATDRNKSISDGAPTVMNIYVSGQTGKVWDVNALTQISHANASEVAIEVQHLGKSVILGDDTTGPFDFYGAGTGLTFDDSAAALLEPASTANPVAPLTGLSAFRGMDPNGVWTLKVTDSTGAFVNSAGVTVGPYNGTLQSWTLDLQTADITAPGGGTGGGTTTSTPTSVTPPPDTTTVATNQTPPAATPPATTPPPATTSTPSQSQPTVKVADFGKSKLAARGSIVWHAGKIRGNVKLVGTATKAGVVTIQFRNKRNPKKVAATIKVRVKAGKVNVNVPVNKRLTPGVYRVDVIAGSTRVSGSTVKSVRRR